MTPPSAQQQPASEPSCRSRRRCRGIYALEAVFTATLLAVVPYLLVRGPVSRVAKWSQSRRYDVKDDWRKPAAMAIPKEGYFELQQGRFGPVYPKTPACYGFSVIAKVKPGREKAIRDYGKTIEKAVRDDPHVLAPLKLHYLRWVLFDVGSGLHFMYQGIFDTDFDKYLEDAVALFIKTGVMTVFVNLEGWPEDWKTNVPAVSKFFREHQCPSFLEYGEYPFVGAEEIKKALRLKAAFSGMLDEMQ